MRSWFNLFKEENTIQINVKKDIKAKKQTLVFLFQELKKFVKKKD